MFFTSYLKKSVFLNIIEFPEIKVVTEKPERQERFIYSCQHYLYSPIKRISITSNVFASDDKLSIGSNHNFKTINVFLVRSFLPSNSE